MAHDKNIWFHWERNATFTPLYMCMEAWAHPTKKYWGVWWPANICVWKNDIVSWDSRNADFETMGKSVVEKLLKTGWKGFEGEIEQTAKKIEMFMKSCDEKNFTKMDESALVLLFRELHALYIHWFVLGITEPPGIYGEKLLEQLSETKHNFSVLTSPSRKSFSRKEFEELLQVKGAAGLEQHAKKYFWLHNNYFTTEVLGIEFFKAELAKLMEKYPDSAAYLDEVEKKDAELMREKQKIMDELCFDDSSRKLVELMEFFAWFQDYRKEITMKMLHYIDVLLGAIGEHHGLSLKEMKHVFPEEIFSGKISKELIRKRMAHFMVIWDEKTEKFEYILEPELIEKRNEELFGKKGHTKEIVEIEGSIASKGRIKGKAFVTMSAAEAKNIKPGQILVTSMTSPDFIAGIKKSAAIVTNEGGILCHAAIISREFGIPCIVGTGNATQLIKTGDLIEVDGNHGFVRIIKI